MPEFFHNSGGCGDVIVDSFLQDSSAIDAELLTTAPASLTNHVIGNRVSGATTGTPPAFTMKFDTNKTPQNAILTTKFTLKVKLRNFTTVTSEVEFNLKIYPCQLSYTLPSNMAVSVGEIMTQTLPLFTFKHHQICQPTITVNGITSPNFPAASALNCIASSSAVCGAIKYLILKDTSNLYQTFAYLKVEEDAVKITLNPTKNLEKQVDSVFTLLAYPTKFKIISEVQTRTL